MQMRAHDNGTEIWGGTSRSSNAVDGGLPHPLPRVDSKGDSTSDADIVAHIYSLYVT